MALSRLLLQKPGHHFHNRALPKSTRWCSSSLSSGAEKSSSLENSEAAKEQRAVAEESDNKNVEMHSGVFLKPTQAQTSTWHTLKGIYTNLKARVLGSPHVQKQITVKKIDPADRTVSEVFKTENSPQNTESGQPNLSIQMPKVIRDPHSCKENIFMSVRSDIIGEKFSSDVLAATASSQFEVHKHLDSTESSELKGVVQSSGGVVCSSGPKNVSSHIMGESTLENLAGLVATKVKKEHVGPKNVGHGASGSLVQSSEAFLDSQNNEKCVTETEASHITCKRSSKDMDQSEVKPGLVATKVKKEHVGPKIVEQGASGSLVQSSEGFVDSRNNEKSVIETEAFHITWNRSSKDMDQSGVKPESHRKLEEVMLRIAGGIESESENLSCLTYQLPGEASRILQKEVANGNHQLDKKTLIFDREPAAGSDVGKITASSDGSQKAMRLANVFMRTMNDQKVGDILGKKSDTLASNGLLEALPETTGEDMGKKYGIDSLLSCIKELPQEGLINASQDCTIANNTDNIIKRRSPVKKVPSRDDSHGCNAKRRESSSKGPAMSKATSTSIGSEEQKCRGIPSMIDINFIREGDSDDVEVAAQKKSKLNPRVRLSTRKEDLDKIPSTFNQKEGSTERKVLVRFLDTYVKRSSISDVFNDCGVEKVRLLPSIKGSKFKDAYVHFKTRKGSQRALMKTDLLIENVDVLVEETSLEDVPNKISIPNLIGDPEVPLGLVKNPTRTVMIKQLTPDISSQQLKEALAFCGSGISSFFLGSSSSVAYVEFETEDAKERAIAAYALSVQGKQLLIFRIDVPRTTVIRISNVLDIASSFETIQSICKRHGQVKKVKKRSKGIVDVHFRLAEWPKMLTILNSLNGMEVDGSQWLAQPASVFPPEVLRVLWSQPDERIHVQSVLRRLLQNIEPTVETMNLATKYYGDIF